MQKQNYPQESVSIFYSYAHEDEKLRERLESHLSLLQQQGLITAWHDRRIDAGTDWSQAIDTHLMNASIILLLISPSFLASKYCYGIEMQQALDRHRRNNARVIPVLLRPTDWEDAPFAHLQYLPRNRRPVTKWPNRDEAFVEIAKSIRAVITEDYSPLDTIPYLSAPMLWALKDSDRDDLLDRRLACFAPGTRSAEVTDIHERIEQLKSMGGYLAITGGAGEGKTTLVAQLIASHRFGQERTPYHIIPFNPGPDHQVTLLRSLMASLATRHLYLPNFWIQTFHRNALAGIFALMLQEISEKGEQEVIFIDGLDQIKPDADLDERDLSFLPLNVPSGIVIVISSRPDDVLRPLQLRSPLSAYRLPKLIPADANRILAHNNIHLRKELVDQLYQVTQQNALYIDLVAKEIIQDNQDNTGIFRIKEIFQHLPSNPDQIFLLSINRLGYPSKSSWKKVIKPLLGLLLAVQEPISASAMSQILELEDEDLRVGLEQLNGLVEKDNKKKYYLYHLKLQEFLKENEEIISLQEKCLRHRQLADWCAGGDPKGGKTIWENTKKLNEQERRIYARQYYIVHLYHAQEWERLFTVIDEEVYEQAKLQHDSNIYSYAQDLDLGRRAAAWEGWEIEEAIAHLPHLWRYTLLQSSLASRADCYPEEAFRFLVILHQKQKAIGLAELLTQAEKKVRVLLHIAEQLRTQGAPEKEWLGLFTRASEVAWSIHDKYQQMEALCCLIKAYALVHKWDYADELIKLVKRSKAKTSALFGLVEALAQAQQWGMAERKIQDIDDGVVQVRAFCVLGKALALAQQRDRAEEMWTKAEKVIRNITADDITERDEALSALGVALALVGDWKRAKHHMHDIESIWRRVKVLSSVICSAAQAQQYTELEEAWDETFEMILKPSVLSNPLISVILAAAEGYGQDAALRDLSEAITWTQRWKQAETLIQAIYGRNEKTEALCNLVRKLAQARQWERANKVLRTIDQQAGKILALCSLGEVSAQFEQWEQAEAIWLQIEHLVNVVEEKREREERLDALTNLSNALAQAQQWEQAENVARTIKPMSAQVRPLLEIGQTLSHAQQWEYAEKIWTQVQGLIDALEQPVERVQALCNLAEVLNQALQHERTQTTLAQAESLSQTIEMARERGTALLALSRTLAQIGEWERAVALVPSIEIDREKEEIWAVELFEKLFRVQQLEQAEALIGTLKWADGKVLYDRIEALAQTQQWEKAVAKALAQAKQTERAEGIWTEVETRIHLLMVDQEKDIALAQLSKALTQTQQWEHAKQVIHTIKQIGTQIDALCELGEALALAQAWVQADMVQTEIEVLAGQIADNQPQVKHSFLASTIKPGTEALRDWSVELIKAKRWKQANKLTETMKFSWLDNDGNLCILIRVLAQTGQWEQANTVANAIRNDTQKIEAFCEIGKALSQAHQWEEADALWTKVENLIFSQESQKTIDALETLEDALVITGNHERWLRIVQQTWLSVRTRQDAIRLQKLARRFIPSKPEIGVEFCKAFFWVDTFFNRLEGR